MHAVRISLAIIFFSPLTYISINIAKYSNKKSLTVKFYCFFCVRSFIMILNKYILDLFPLQQINLHEIIKNNRKGSHQ